MRTGRKIFCRALLEFFVEISTLTRDVRARIINRALPAGGWASGNGNSANIETTCLALMALREAQGPVYEKSRGLLEHVQNPDGSWPAFAGDDSQGCWTTSLAFVALHAIQTRPGAVENGLPWLLRNKGREGHWLWNLKFRFADRKVRFNPDKYGWSWFPGTVSWVIPTAFALIALQHSFQCCQSEPVSNRIQLGREMLFDRACPGGGWNAGNGVVLGSPLKPHIDATAIALIALANQTGHEATASGLTWLRQRYLECFSPYSLAWSVLAFAAHKDEAFSPAIKLLENSFLQHRTTVNVETLSVVAIALAVAQGEPNPFQVEVIDQ